MYTLIALAERAKHRAKKENKNFFMSFIHLRLYISKLACKVTKNITPEQIKILKKSFLFLKALELL
jgi:hypothetical protein